MTSKLPSGASIPVPPAFAPHLTDFYKTGHYAQYPNKTEFVYANLTARHDGHAKLGDDFDHKIVLAGIQSGLAYIIHLWNTTFFNCDKSEVIARYKRRMDRSLGQGVVSVDHLEALHNLGYLPIHIKALPEGSRVSMKVPFLTIINTQPDFYWLTNYLETALSLMLWKTITTATIAYEYRKLLEHYAQLTGADKAFVPYQGHDFSMRGTGPGEDAAFSGIGHLFSFKGTDTISAIDYAEAYYDAEDEDIGGSVPATEHSVMCMGGETDEIETFRRLITEVYPTGIVSIVSDTWDFWQVLTVYLPQLKTEILARQSKRAGSKVVIRPDSGDPVKIICGTAPHINAFGGSRKQLWDAGYKYFQDVDGLYYQLTVVHQGHGPGYMATQVEPTPEMRGAVDVLYSVFGGSETHCCYKELNAAIGLIYGDSITLERANAILSGLEAKGYASSNIVFGIGSYTYQYITRDTFGMAVKATWGVVDGEECELFKNPKTDSGVKKSAAGLLHIGLDSDGNFVLSDRQTKEQESTGEMRTVFKDNQFFVWDKLSVCRARLGW